MRDEHDIDGDVCGLAEDSSKTGARLCAAVLRASANEIRSTITRARIRTMSNMTCVCVFPQCFSISYLFSIYPLFAFFCEVLVRVWRVSGDLELNKSGS